MTEEEKIYFYSKNQKTLESFKGMKCARPFFTGEYIPPTPAQVQSLISAMGWNQQQVAMITGVSWTKKGSSTVRKWKTEEGPEMRVIPYAAWRQMLECARIVDTKEVLRWLK